MTILSVVLILTVWFTLGAVVALGVGAVVRVRDGQVPVVRVPVRGEAS